MSDIWSLGVQKIRLLRAHGVSTKQKVKESQSNSFDQNDDLELIKHKANKTKRIQFPETKPNGPK